MMYIGNEFIESVPLETDSISKPGYLGNIKRLLKSKHREMILQNSVNPEFLVIDHDPATYHLKNNTNNERNQKP